MVNTYIPKSLLKTFDIKTIKNIEIKDSAGGIPDNIIDRIFEAYFTIKHQS